MNKGTRQLIMGLIYLGAAICVLYTANKELSNSNYINAILSVIVGLYFVDKFVVLTEKSTK